MKRTSPLPAHLSAHLSAPWLRCLLVGIFAVAGLGLPLRSTQADVFLDEWHDHYQPSGRFSLTPSLSYDSTSENYDANGNKAIPADFNRLTRTIFATEAVWGLHRYVTAYGTMRWARVQLDHNTLGGERFGLSDQTLGATVQAYSSQPRDPASGTNVRLQLQADFAAYDRTTTLSSTNQNVDTPVLGDGTQDFTFGAFFNTPFRKSHLSSYLLSAGLGYMYRTTGFAPLLPWSVSIKYVPSVSGLTFGIGAFGIRFLSAASRSPYWTQAPYSTLNGDGGSYRSMAPEPTLLNVRGSLGYRFESGSELQATATQSLLGQFAPAGFQLAVGYQFTWNSNPANVAANDQTPEEYGRPNRGFLNYNLDAKVTQTNEKLNLVRIDRGIVEGVGVGQTFDIFSVTTNGKIEQAVARARVSSARDHDAVLNVLEYYREVFIEKDFVAKRALP